MLFLFPLIMVENKKACDFSQAFVGMARFELATSWSQTRRDDRTTLHPVQHKADFGAVRAGFEPAVQFPVRQFSKLVVSATHPSHPYSPSKKECKYIIYFLNCL